MKYTLDENEIKEIIKDWFKREKGIEASNISLKPIGSKSGKNLSNMKYHHNCTIAEIYEK